MTAEISEEVVREAREESYAMRYSMLAVLCYQNWPHGSHGYNVVYIKACAMDPEHSFQQISVPQSVVSICLIILDAITSPPASVKPKCL